MKNRFRNAMQMKAFIKKEAARKAIDPRLLLQEYALDDLLERIALSRYQKNLVLKGGFLIASMIGVNVRSTRDLDATIVGMPLTEQHIMQVFKEICAINIEDDPITLYPTSVKRIRKADAYGGYRVGFKGQIYGSIEPEIKIDLSTGDVMTPREIKYQHHLLTEDRTITVMAYNLETSLAEKLEACLNNGELNTRAKDYYDIYVLTHLEWQNIDFGQLKAALHNTAKHRGSLAAVNAYEANLKQIAASAVVKAAWEAYRRDRAYAQAISFDAALASIEKVMAEIQSRGRKQETT